MKANIIPMSNPIDTDVPCFVIEYEEPTGYQEWPEDRQAEWYSNLEDALTFCLQDYGFRVAVDGSHLGKFLKGWDER